MNEQDLRDCFAMFALLSYWKDPDVSPDVKTAAAWSYDMADAMLEARKGEPEEGIVAIKKRVRKPK
jgi:hypothetical protein